MFLCFILYLFLGFLCLLLTIVGSFRLLGRAAWGFQLVADGNTVSGTDKLRQIVVEGMVWEACHFEGLAFGILCLTALGEGDTQHL